MAKEITLKDIVETIVKNYRVLLACFVIVVAGAFLAYQLIPRSYTAAATIVPTSNQAGAGGLSSLLSSSSLGMLANPELSSNIIFVALKSRTLAENVLNKFPSTELIVNKTAREMTPQDREAAVEKLRNNILKVYPGKNGSIVVEATLRDREKAAYLVNQYLSELALFLNDKAISMSFTVIDPAEPPLAQSAPKLTIIIAAAFCLAFILSAAYLTAAIYAGK
jgi:uncharacterized protein involved in exopolysaccharide biosynthesis